MTSLPQALSRVGLADCGNVKMLYIQPASLRASRRLASQRAAVLTDLLFVVSRASFTTLPLTASCFGSCCAKVFMGLVVVLRSA